MVRPGGVMEWSLPLNVELVNGSFVLEEDINDHVLTIIASNVKRSTTMSISNINLKEKKIKEGDIKKKKI